MITCTQCGTENVDGSAFCDNCGAELSQVSPTPEQTPAPPASAQPAPPTPTPATPPPQQPQPPVSPPPAPPVTTGLKIFLKDSGQEIAVPNKPEIFIGREDPVSGIFPEIDTTPYDGENLGVSRKHAKITFQGGQYLVEDLDSVNHTFVNQVKLAPNQPMSLNNGDELVMGRLKFAVQIS